MSRHTKRRALGHLPPSRQRQHVAAAASSQRRDDIQPEQLTLVQAASSQTLRVLPP